MLPESNVGEKPRHDITQKITEGNTSAELPSGRVQDSGEEARVTRILYIPVLSALYSALLLYLLRSILLSYLQNPPLILLASLLILLLLLILLCNQLQQQSEVLSKSLVKNILKLGHKKADLLRSKAYDSHSISNSLTKGSI